MKQILFIVAFTFSLWIPSTKAQEIITDEINYNTMEKLIQMAKDYYPQRKIVGEREGQSKNDVVIENISYLDMVNVSYFWRPGDRRVLDELNPYVTNGIQVGVNLSPSRLISKPFRVKNAKSDHEIAKLQKQAFDASLETQVKTLYYEYVLQLKNFKQRTVAAQASKGQFLDLSTSFQVGEITMEDYDDARVALTNTEYSRLQSEISFLRARDSLEEIIGKKITEVKD